MDEIEREAIKLTSIIKASERWSPQYAKAPAAHAKLLKNASIFQITLRRYFSQMAKKAPDFFNHYQYLAQVNSQNKATMHREALAYDVSVIVNDDQLDEWDDIFINMSFQPISGMILAGAQAGEQLYNVPLGIQGTDAIIQNLTTDRVAALVGKKVLRNKDGTVREIIDNPNPKYNINETVRNDIAASIQTSLLQGETTEEAIARIQDIIDDPMRAERIANTESVNAYQSGLLEFADQSGAVQKQWEDAGATDVCAEYAGQDPIDIDDTWDDLDAPPAHPNCLCSIRLIYQSELDGGDSSDIVDEEDI